MAEKDGFPLCYSPIDKKVKPAEMIVLDEEDLPIITMTGVARLVFDASKVMYGVTGIMPKAILVPEVVRKKMGIAVGDDLAGLTVVDESVIVRKGKSDAGVNEAD